MPVKKIFKSIFTILILVYFGFGIILFAFQSGYIYFPSRQDFDKCPDFSDSERLDMDGTRAYHKKTSDKLVVFYHGNGGSSCDRAFLKNIFSDSGYSYLFVEYAGYSDDSKKSSQEAILKDVRNVDNYIKTAGYDEFAIAGESIGTSPAFYHSSIANEDRLLLISPFYSLKEIARQRFPIYPVSWMLRDTYESFRWIDDIKQVKIIHGTADTIVPIGESKKLYDNISDGEKIFIEIPGAGHNDIYEYPETFSAIKEFLIKN